MITLAHIAAERPALESAQATAWAEVKALLLPVTGGVDALASLAAATREPEILGKLEKELLGNGTTSTTAPES